MLVNDEELNSTEPVDVDDLTWTLAEWAVSSGARRIIIALEHHDHLAGINGPAAGLDVWAEGVDNVATVRTHLRSSSPSTSRALTRIIQEISVQPWSILSLTPD